MTAMRDVMWATMEPDCYHGKDCNKILPRWNAYADGDKQGDYENKLTLDSRDFPPGSKVVISVPVCPNCEFSADYAVYNNYPKKTDFQNLKCECGFDWTDWTYNEYS